MQKVRFIQRNFTTTLKSFQKTDTYVTIPEKLRDFEDRVNALLSDDWRLHSCIPELVNGAAVPIVILVRDV